MKRIAFAILAGCVAGPPQPWGASDLSVEGTGAFESHVAEAVSRWDEALYSRCGTVLTIVPDGGHPVREYTETDWPGSMQQLGFFDGDQVAIRSEAVGDGWLNLTLHELGHSMGLGHVSWDEDPHSVMIDVVVVPFDRPTEGDVSRAAEALGCP
jgi:hypothetical protein